MTLIEDWKKVAPKLWSVRLALLAAAASAAEGAWIAYTTGQAPIVAIIGFAFSIASAGARIVAQPGVFDGAAK